MQCRSSCWRKRNCFRCQLSISSASPASAAAANTRCWRLCYRCFPLCSCCSSLACFAAAASCLVTQVVNFKYPEQLRQLTFSWDYMMKGLIIDKVRAACSASCFADLKI